MKTFLKFLICSLIILVSAIPVAANGTPIKIFLNYLPEFSNYGLTNATGVAMISFGEAWVDLQAEGLPQLNGQLYEAWLLKTDTNEMISLGKFNANPEGRVAYHADFEQLPEADYRYFFISVEPDPDPGSEADARRTIAGIFPNAEALDIPGTPTPTLAPGVTPTLGAPIALPVTGLLNFQNPNFWFFPLTIGAVSVGVIFILAGLFYRRRKHL
jgi:hypothetical protein